ncbi:hypothetical protein RSAG8_01115, partial [Rhizoctonia solani AG-8 WAC10335]
MFAKLSTALLFLAAVSSPAAAAAKAAKVKRSEVTVAEAEAALAEDLERRSTPMNKKRYLKSRIAGGKAGEWI